MFFYEKTKMNTVVSIIIGAYIVGFSFTLAISRLHYNTNSMSLFFTKILYLFWLIFNNAL